MSDQTVSDKLVLGLDTASRQGAVALVQGDRVLGEINLAVKRTFSEKLLPAIDELLKSSGVGLDDLDLIAVTQGPGSFTGLRIGLATAKGLAYTQGKPVAGVGSLEVLAWAAEVLDRPLSVALPARQGWVYRAAYCRNGQTLQCLEEPVLESVDQWVSHLSRNPSQTERCLIGEAVLQHREMLQEVLGGREIDLDPKRHFPQGKAVAELGWRQYQRSARRGGPAVAGRAYGQSAGALVPLYLQPSMAELKWRQDSGF